MINHIIKISLLNNAINFIKDLSFYFALFDIETAIIDSNQFMLGSTREVSVINEDKFDYIYEYA